MQRPLDQLASSIVDSFLFTFYCKFQLISVNNRQSLLIQSSLILWQNLLFWCQQKLVISLTGHPVWLCRITKQWKKEQVTRCCTADVCLGQSVNQLYKTEIRPNLFFFPLLAHHTFDIICRSEAPPSTSRPRRPTRGCRRTSWWSPTPSCAWPTRCSTRRRSRLEVLRFRPWGLFHKTGLRFRPS